jgi:SMODS and SLOG-associating 2TM effector domain 2
MGFCVLIGGKMVKICKGRKNISARKFIRWDEYTEKPPPVALESIYSYITDFAASTTGWYWRSIKTKRRTSISIRAFSFFLLAFGTAAQFYATTLGDVQNRLDTTQAAIAAFAIAALMTVADRAFGWSGGWLRYVLTVTTMENLIRAFQLEWAKYFVSKDGVVDHGDVKALFLLAQGLEQELLKLQGEETAKWATEFNAGIEILESAIKTQREEADKKVNIIRATLASQEAENKAQEKSRATGSIELTLLHAVAVKPVRIIFDSDAPVDFLGASWVKLNIFPGQHEIKVITVDEPVQTISRVVDIQPFAVSRVDVKLGGGV